MSKERVARILSSLDSQIKIEPVKPRASQCSVFNIPSVSGSSGMVHSLQSSPSVDRRTFCTDSPYNMSTLHQSWTNPSSQYYVNNRPAYSGPLDKQELNTSHMHYGQDPNALLTSNYGQRYVVKENENVSPGSSYEFSGREGPTAQPEASLFDSMEDRIYGYNQTGKYYFNGQHVKSEVKTHRPYNRADSGDLQVDFTVEGINGTDRNRKISSESVQKVDHHAILRQKLTVPDEEEVLAPIFSSPSQKSQMFSTSHSYIPSLSPVTSSSTGADFCSPLLTELIACDKMLDLTDLYKMTQQLSSDRKSATKILCELGDRVVSKFVKWTKQLPFFSEIPIEVHSHLLTSKWHELLLLVTTAYKSDQSESVSSLTKDDLYAHYMRKLQVALYLFFHTPPRQVVKCKWESEIFVAKNVI